MAAGLGDVKRILGHVGTDASLATRQICKSLVIEMTRLFAAIYCMYVDVYGVWRVGLYGLCYMVYGNGIWYNVSGRWYAAYVLVYVYSVIIAYHSICVSNLTPD